MLRDSSSCVQGVGIWFFADHLANGCHRITEVGLGVGPVDQHRDRVRPVPVPEAVEHLRGVTNDRSRAHDVEIAISHLDFEGEPYTFSPRYALQQAVADWAELGYTPKVGLELEDRIRPGDLVVFAPIAQDLRRDLTRSLEQHARR